MNEHPGEPEKDRFGQAWGRVCKWNGGTSFGPDWEVVEAAVRFRESPRKVKPPEGKRRQVTETIQPRLKIISQDPLSWSLCFVGAPLQVPLGPNIV